MTEDAKPKRKRPPLPTVLPAVTLIAVIQAIGLLVHSDAVAAVLTIAVCAAVIVREVWVNRHL